MSNAEIKKGASILYTGLILSAALLPLTACDALTGGNKVAGSCDWRPAKGDRCFEYPDADAKKECGSGRVWRDGPCDHTGALCGARLSSGIQKWIFAGTGTTKEQATTECGRDTLLGPDGKPVK